MKKKTMKCEFVLVFLFLLIFGMVPVLLADSGVNQYLPDQLHDQKPTFLDDDKDDDGGIFVGGISVRDILSEDDGIEGESAFLSGLSKKVIETDEEMKDGIQEKDSFISGDYANRAEYLEYDYKSITKRVARLGNSNFSINYNFDDYSYDDERKIFQKTFNDEKDSRMLRTGILFFSMARFYHKSFFDLAWGVNLGIGFNRARGVFENDPERSNCDAIFKLWTLPVDFSALIIEIPLFGPWVKLSAAGGPSVMGLMQTRSDFEDGESKKRRRQVGFGYFHEYKFKMSLGDVFTDTGFKLYSNYKVTRLYLDASMRFHDYSNFQDEIKISGSSVGFGLTFEYF